jgi:hypothetical protein
MLRHLSQIQFHPRGEDRFLEISALLIGLGLIGLKLAWDQKLATGKFLAALAVGFLPMLAGYRFRYFSSQGQFPWLLLAGLTLDRLVARSRAWIAGAGLVAVVLGAPTLLVSPERITWVLGETTLSLLAGRPPSIYRATAQPLYHRKMIRELTDQILAQTGPGDLIYCNVSYIGGLLGLLTGRAMTTSMLREMVESSEQERIVRARLIVWLKLDPSPLPGLPLEETVQTHRLEEVGETELARLFLNPAATGKRREERALVPWWLTTGLIAGAAGIIFWDLKGV